MAIPNLAQALQVVGAQSPVGRFFSSVGSSIAAASRIVSNKFDMAVAQKSALDTAAGTKILDGIPFFHSRGKNVVAEVNLFPTDDVATDPNNYATISLIKWSGGVRDATPLATISTNSAGGVAFVHGIAISMPLAGASDLALVGGDWLTIEIDKAGTGVQTGRFAVAVKVNPALRVDDA